MIIPQARKPSLSCIISFPPLISRLQWCILENRGGPHFLSLLNSLSCSLMVFFLLLFWLVSLKLHSRVPHWGQNEEGRLYSEFSSWGIDKSLGSHPFGGWMPRSCSISKIISFDLPTSCQRSLKHKASPRPYNLPILKGKEKTRKIWASAVCQMSERKKHLLEPPSKTKQNISQIKEKRKILRQHKWNVWQLNKLLHQPHFGGGYKYKHHKISSESPRESRC